MNKKIIDGKRYDTETSTMVHSWDNGHYGSDFRSREKALYRTKKGNWFLWHSGGPMTDMAVSCGNNSVCGSENIEPISAKDAFGFLQTHGGAEAAEKYFPELIEDA